MMNTPSLKQGKGTTIRGYDDPIQIVLIHQRLNLFFAVLDHDEKKDKKSREPYYNKEFLHLQYSPDRYDGAVSGGLGLDSGGGRACDICMSHYQRRLVRPLYS